MRDSGGRLGGWRHLAAAAALCAGVAAAAAATFKPASDAQVLERLPPDARSRELAALRAAVARDPRDAQAAVALAERHFAIGSAEGDPRHIGYAQAALAPWWTQAAPPPRVRVQRAVLLQFNHRFDEALADLDAAVRADPADAQAWAWIAAISMVRARYPRARQACERAGEYSSELNAAACTASVDAMTGQARAAATALDAALAAHPNSSADERLWALTRLAETRERLGAEARAEAAFREALAIDRRDGYLLAAYADFLLDRGRAREVLELLKDKTRSDILLLRLAIAAKAAGDPAAAGWSDALESRFAAARARGDDTHAKEEARFALALRGDAARALQLALSNFQVQKEAADARVLLEAALAAGQPSAASPALDWMREAGVESVVLARLAAQLKAKQ